MLKGLLRTLRYMASKNQLLLRFKNQQTQQILSFEGI